MLYTIQDLILSMLLLSNGVGNTGRGKGEGGKTLDTYPNKPKRTMSQEFIAFSSSLCSSETVVPNPSKRDTSFVSHEHTKRVDTISSFGAGAQTSMAQEAFPLALTNAASGSILLDGCRVALPQPCAIHVRSAHPEFQLHGIFGTCTCRDGTTSGHLGCWKMSITEEDCSLGIHACDCAMVS